MNLEEYDGKKDITGLFERVVARRTKVKEQVNKLVTQESSMRPSQPNGSPNISQYNKHAILKPIKKTQFITSCIQVHTLLTNLEEYLRENRLAYLQGPKSSVSSSLSSPTPSMSETDRHRLEAETVKCLKQCEATIVQLQGGLTSKSRHRNEMSQQLIDHHSRILLSLVDLFESVSKYYYQQTAEKLAKSLEERQGYLTRHTSLVSEVQRSSTIQRSSTTQLLSTNQSTNQRSSSTSPKHSNNIPPAGSSNSRKEEDGVIHDSNINYDLSNLDIQTQEMLRKDNLLLQASLANMSDDIRQVEQQVMAISQAQQLIAHNLKQQRDDLEHIHTQSKDAQVAITKGNTELEKAAQKGSAFRVFILLFLLAASFGLLFVHWMSR